MPIKWIHILILGCILLLNNSLYSQNKIQLIPESSSVHVFGTSNVHDWQMFVEFDKNTSDYKIPNNSIKDLKNIEFKIKGIQLRSKEKAMEKMAHKALKIFHFPEIKFMLKRITIKSHKSTSFIGFAVGILTVSGQKKNIRLPINGNFTGKRKINIRGHIDLKMSDFKVDPPKAFLGAVSTSDDIKILYSLDFSSKQKLTQDMLSMNLMP
ncbi:YceI family protein [Ancylomarina sp. DW003]|nr:YceI family protein [Ancylomarina sp. DW003]MDE5424233.1 YceI family protein [Ancylomarina sp. DW003]